MLEKIAGPIWPAARQIAGHQGLRIDRRQVRVTEEPQPIAYTALTPGVPMLSSSGREFGAVERVLEIPEQDLFDGIVVNTSDGERFVDADQVGEITTAYVRCTVSDEEAAALPAPGGKPIYQPDKSGLGGGVGDRISRMFRRGRWKERR
jgi:hypothetical protein